MKKSRGVVTLICTLLLLAGCIYTAIFGVGQDKSGSAESIKLGLDLAGGVSITYQVVGKDTTPVDLFCSMLDEEKVPYSVSEFKTRYLPLIELPK